jgi:hypothetical protein
LALKESNDLLKDTIVCLKNELILLGDPKLAFKAPIALLRDELVLLRTPKSPLKDPILSLLDPTPAL